MRVIPQLVDTLAIGREARGAVVAHGLDCDARLDVRLVVPGVEGRAQLGAEGCIDRARRARGVRCAASRLGANRHGRRAGRSAGRRAAWPTCAASLARLGPGDNGRFLNHDGEAARLVDTSPVTRHAAQRRPRAVQDAVRAYVQDRIAPHAARWDREQPLPEGGAARPRRARLLRRRGADRVGRRRPRLPGARGHPRGDRRRRRRDVDDRQRQQLPGLLDPDGVGATTRRRSSG